MSIKYLDSLKLQELDIDALDEYARKMMQEQIDILDLIDQWTDCFNLINEEYDRRRAERTTFIENNSTTRH